MPDITNEDIFIEFLSNIFIPGKSETYAIPNKIANTTIKTIENPMLNALALGSSLAFPSHSVMLEMFKTNPNAIISTSFRIYEGSKFLKNK